MNTLLTSVLWSTYLLPSTIALAVFYLLYKGLVRNDTHLKCRRFLMLGFLIFAMVLPFLNFQIPVNNIIFGNAVETGHALSLRNFVYELPVFSVFAEGGAVGGVVETHGRASLQMFNIINWIYLVVVLLLVVRGLVGILRLIAFSRKGKNESNADGTTIISSPNIPTAFSFFRWIFIPETWYHGNEREMVLRHERVHVNQKHSWDLMLMEVICVVQFFNPFVWLLKREMRLNHEYLADKETLQNTENPEQYFHLLLQKIIGKHPAFVHSLHYSPIKNRIMMQLSKPAKMLNQVRYLAFVPIALALTFLFACQGKFDVFEDILPPENVETTEVAQLYTLDSDIKTTLVEIGRRYDRDSLLFVDDRGIFLYILSEDKAVRYTGRIDEWNDFIGGFSDNRTIGLRAMLLEAGAPKDEVDRWFERFHGVYGGRMTEKNTNQKTTSTNDENKIYQIVDDAPLFPGGEDARMQFLRDNIKFPAEAREKGIQGTVFATFVVERDGSITDVKIVRGIGGGCDEEVVRVIQKMPNWAPGKMEGQPVRVQFMMPIRFVTPAETAPTESEIEE